MTAVDRSNFGLGRDNTPLRVGDFPSLGATSGYDCLPESNRGEFRARTQWSNLHLPKLRWARLGHRMGTTWAQMQNALTERAFAQRKSLILLVAREGFEPPTFGL